jgi:hypothetical protein
MGLLLNVQQLKDIFSEASSLSLRGRFEALFMGALACINGGREVTRILILKPSECLHFVFLLSMLVL